MESVNLSMRGRVTESAPKTKKVRSVGGSIAGLATGAAVQTGVSLGAGMGVVKAMQKFGEVPADKVKILHDAAEKALDISGMKAKGVKLEYVAETKNKIKGIKAFFADASTQIANGMNAGFASNNKIYMPEKAIPFASFHEIGHSINYNSSAFWGKMQKMRVPAMALAFVPLIYGALTKKSVAKDGQELTKRQKLNNAIRDNAGKLSFAAMLPVLAEEAMASIRGVKLANKVLDANLAKHVAKGNCIAYMSYLGGAIALGLAAFAGVKIKDHFIEKKAAKLAAQEQNTQTKAA